MRGRAASSAAIMLLVPLAACDRPKRVDSDTSAPTTMVLVDTGLVRHRADWDAFQQALPTDPAGAAAALERYRDLHGLPLDFFLDARAPESLRKALASDDDMSCGAVITAFVRSIPLRHSLLSTSRVLEIDSAGRTLREWQLGSDADLWDPIVGVSGDELIASFGRGPRGVYMRVKPSGEYRISAEPPPALPPEEWIALADSNWVRVRPNDHMTMHSRFTHPVDAGRWEPMRDSAWYVRVDSGPGRGDTAHSIPEPHGRTPHFLACPASTEFQGMICRGFPDGGKERRIASPTQCT